MRKTNLNNKNIVLAFNVVDYIYTEATTFNTKPQYSVTYWL